MIDWQQAATFIIACGGVGAFVDFYIGRNGQNKVKAQLETFWIKLAYVNVKTFTRAEATFAHEILLQLFGKSFSRRRVAAIATVVGILSLIWGVFYLLNLDFYTSTDRPSKWKMGSITPHFPSLPWIILILFWWAISVTIWLSRFLRDTISERIWANIPLFFFFIWLQLSSVTVIAALALSLATLLNYGWTSAIDQFTGQTQGIINDITSIDLLYDVFDSQIFIKSESTFSDYMDYMVAALHIFPGILRLSIIAIFAASVILKPVHQFILLTLQRMIEIDKPIFTIAFTGIAATAKTLQTVF